MAGDITEILEGHKKDCKFCPVGEGMAPEECWTEKWNANFTFDEDYLWLLCVPEAFEKGKEVERQ